MKRKNKKKYQNSKIKKEYTIKKYTLVQEKYFGKNYL
jgi:hypothetical protein